ncbi:hypothetical protein GCM10019016_016210 [Streptomyces prasinosporus]|uniref:Uncharacterized protein n=1 Tax=Streptomyces prasinosporus TaxID=68256 RepID=A0ABP6TJ51_9ACTN
MRVRFGPAVGVLVMVAMGSSRVFSAAFCGTEKSGSGGPEADRPRIRDRRRVIRYAGRGALCA